MAISPQDISSLLALQGHYWKKGMRYSILVKKYSKPATAPAHNNLGSVLFRQGKYEEAAAHCTRALQLNPQLPEAYYNLGNIRFQQDDFEHAVINYQKALSLRPGWPQVQKNLSMAKNRMQTP